MLSLILIALVAGVQSQQNPSDNYNYICTFVDALDCSNVNYSPVCANNGVQYKSECDFTKAHCKDVTLDVAYNGPCKATTAPPTTTTTTKPTTATTTKPTTAAGTTPSSSSTATTASMTSSPTSAPTGPPVTTVGTGSTPMVSSSATTTANTIAASTPSSSVLCQTILATACPPDDSPVCGSDLVSYKNLCEYTKASCYNPTLSVLQSGTCASVSTTPPPSVFDIICRALEGQQCYNDGMVLCGSDGVTYPNSCDYEKAKCQDSTLSVISSGAC